MSQMTPKTVRRLLASSLPVATMIVTGALLVGGCTTSTEVSAARPAASTHVVESHEGSSLQFLADAMAKEGKYDAAIPLYRRAHALHPHDAGPLLGLGTSLAAMGANSEAIEALKAAHDRDDDNPEIAVKLADVYLAINRPELALPLYSQVLTENPRDVSALNGKALALDATGDHQSARNAYEAGLAADPDNLKIESNLGLSMALNGKANESIQMLEDAATDPRAGPNERQNLALAYALAGHDDKASKVASIDFDPVTVDSNLAYYDEIKAMNPDTRTRMMLNGTRAPKENTEEPANFRYGAEEAQAKVTIDRLVGKPSATIEPVEKPIEPASIEITEKPIQPARAEAADRPKVEPAVQTAPITEVPPLLGAEGYAVQIAAYRKAHQLISGWNILHKRYADLIGTLSPRRSEVDFGKRHKDPEGFFYRLNAGPLTTYKEAKDICDEILKRGGPCWVRSPEPSEGHVPTDKPADMTRSASAKTAPAAKQPGKAKLDIDALVKDETAKPARSASTTVWEQVGGPEAQDGAQQQPDQAPQNGDANAGSAPDQGGNAPPPENTETPQ